MLWRAGLLLALVSGLAGCACKGTYAPSLDPKAVYEEVDRTGL